MTQSLGVASAIVLTLLGVVLILLDEPLNRFFREAFGVLCNVLSLTNFLKVAKALIAGILVVVTFFSGVGVFMLTAIMLPREPEKWWVIIDCFWICVFSSRLVFAGTISEWMELWK